MKDLGEMLKEQLNVNEQEQNVNEAKQSLANVVQWEDSKGAAYTTLDTEQGLKKFKHAFLSYNQYEGAVFVVAFNSIEEYQDLIDSDDDEYSALLTMKPQDVKVVNNVSYICLK